MRFLFCEHLLGFISGRIRQGRPGHSLVRRISNGWLDGDWQRCALQSRKLARTTTCLRQPSLVSLHYALFAKPRKRLLKNPGRTCIRRHHHPIVHPFALAASCNDTGATQVGQMPRYLGLRLSQDLNEIADADLLISHEVQEPKPRGVAKSLKKTLHVETIVLGFHKNNYICIDECMELAI